MVPDQNATGQFGVIILAAGSSSRLGHPKQLLNYNGTTLLSFSLEVARASKLQPIVVVLGAHADTLKRETDFSKTDVVINPDWKEGMASSIRCGVQFLRSSHQEIEGTIIMVCDQPKINESVLFNLITAHLTSHKPIIASGYDDTFGPPVFFHQSFFEELLLLKNDVGARSVIRNHPDSVEIIPFAEGTFDIDTEEDLEKMKNANQNISER